jgi:hypothetical protein
VTLVRGQRYVSALVRGQKLIADSQRRFGCAKETAPGGSYLRPLRVAWTIVPFSNGGQSDATDQMVEESLR